MYTAMSVVVGMHIVCWPRGHMRVTQRHGTRLEYSHKHKNHAHVARSLQHRMSVVCGVGVKVGVVVGCVRAHKA
jgi:hypothetical protein